MKNLVQHGDTIPLTAPAGGVSASMPYLIGSIFGVAVISADEGEEFELCRRGVCILPKTTGQAWSEGDVLYFDPATGKLTTTAGNLKPVAAATSDALAADASGNAVIVPALRATPVAAITDAAVAAGANPTQAEFNAAVGKLNAALAALRAANIITD